MLPEDSANTPTPDQERTGQDPLHCLLVDDDPMVLAIVTAFLEAMDYQVSTATDGKEALDIFRSRGLDLVVTDVKMPDIDGIEVLRAIRETDPDMPVVMISGYTEIENVLEAIDLGANNFLLKPLSMEDFQRVVGRIQEMQAMTPSLGKAGLCHQQILRYTAQSKPQQARQLVHQMARSAVAIGFCKDDLPGALKLALTEAVINAMEHGNRWEADRVVCVECELTPTSLRVTVEDEGAGFDYENRPDPTDPENLLLERGRGIFLMNAAMDRVEYHPPGNRVTLYKS